MTKTFKNVYLSILFCTIAVLIGAGATYAQSEKECKDKEKEKATKSVNKNKSRNKSSNRNKTHKSNKWKINSAPKIVVKVPKVPLSPPTPVFGFRTKGDSDEKSIKVNAKSIVSFCVSRGKIKVNGWNRNEVRAFVDGSKQIGIKVIEKSRDKKEPVWVKVIGYDPEKTETPRRSECISGKVIELDVPFGATIDAKGGVGGTTIDSVAKVKLKKVGGDVIFNNIKYGIYAINYEGNIIVNKSGGSMNLETTTGNIVAVRAFPKEWGDTFKAKTNSGAVVLQDVEYRQGEIFSTSGSIKFMGKILANSQFEFTTIDGSITLQIPKDSNADLNATYGGNFISKIPFKNIKKGGDSNVRTISATMGKSGAKLLLETFQGTILIDEQ